MKNLNFILVLGLILLLAILVILEPLVIFWLGYFSGWITKIIIGDKICKAFLVAFGVSIDPSILPWIGGALAWVCSFFKSINTSPKIQKGDR